MVVSRCLANGGAVVYTGAPLGKEVKAQQPPNIAKMLSKGKLHLVPQNRPKRISPLMGILQGDFQTTKNFNVVTKAFTAGV